MITYVLPFFLALGSCCAYLTTVNKSKRFGKTFFRLQVTWKSHFCSVSLLGRAGGALTLPTIQLASIPSAFLHTFPNMVSSNESRNFPHLCSCSIWRAFWYPHQREELLQHTAKNPLQKRVKRGGWDASIHFLLLWRIVAASEDLGSACRHSTRTMDDGRYDDFHDNLIMLMMIMIVLIVIVVIVTFNDICSNPPAHRP